MILVAIALSGATLQGAQGQVVRRPELRVAIATDGVEFLSGDEIPVRFTITHAGGSPYHFQERSSDRSGRMHEFGLSVFDEAGRQLPDVRTLSPIPRGYIGGGLSTPAVLETGEQLIRTILLNLWALPLEPGNYTITGHYRLQVGGAIASAPIALRILPRTAEEMASHVERLAVALRRADDTVRPDVIRKLMFTGHPRAAMPLLELQNQDNNVAFWIGEAFAYYLPRDSATLALAIRTIQEHGLEPSSIGVLEQMGATQDTIKALIGQSLLRRDDAGAQPEAAMAAQRYVDDGFMPALIALAMTGPELTRVRAIHALAANRTDDGVEALRALRRDSSAVIRRAVETAVRGALQSAGARAGRPLRRDDFPDLASPR